MKNAIIFFQLILLASVFVSQGCKKDSEGCTDKNALNYNADATKDDGSCEYSSENKPTFTFTRSSKTVTVEGTTQRDVKFYADTTYFLKGFVYVKDGAVLTIEPGTIIKGEKGTKGSLIIERGAKIIAEGTLQKPIIFTSAEAPGNRDFGDWGGVIVCGKAPVNLPSGDGVVEGGTGSFYGGNDPDDDSGIIKYVRIEFAGIPFQPNQEINGLTLAGVGRKTVVDYVQISYSGDDAFEWFGGTCNAKHLVSFVAWDDDFDTDQGWQGNVQFAVALRDPSIADASGSNGFESDNLEGGSDYAPYTSGAFSNVSLFGPIPNLNNPSYNIQFRSGLHLRKNTRLATFNSIIAGWPEGLYILNATTEQNATNNLLEIENCIIAGNYEFQLRSSFSFNIHNWFFASGKNNDTLSTSAELKINDPFNLSNPNFMPMSGSPVLNKASFANAKLQGTFFEPVSFIGAFGNDNWMQGWTNFDPQNTVY
jgi:hypothetical protein